MSGTRAHDVVDIVDTIALTLTAHDVPSQHPAGRLTVDDVLAADRWARDHTQSLLKDAPA